MAQEQEKTLLLIGCGDLGSQLGLRFLKKSWRVIGQRRSVDKLPKGIEGIAADFTAPESLSALNDVAADYIFITLTPASSSEAGYHSIFVDGLKAILSNINSSRLKHIFFASSTSVYHQAEHEWVTEDSPTEPSSYSGRAVLAGEQLLANAKLPETTGYSVLRFSGIYGPGRDRLLNTVRDGKCAPMHPVFYSNRIHSEDCVGIVEHFILQAEEGKKLAASYLCSDDLPVAIADVHQWLADQLDTPYRSKENFARRTGSKRCDNSRLINSGYNLQYPSFKEGYMQAFGL
jgi:nucleoside-diphosphate-sugar epimerase